MFKTPFYFKYEIFEEQLPHSRDFSHELGNVSF